MTPQLPPMKPLPPLPPVDDALTVEQVEEVTRHIGECAASFRAHRDAMMALPEWKIVVQLMAPEDQTPLVSAQEAMRAHKVLAPFFAAHKKYDRDMQVLRPWVMQVHDRFQPLNDGSILDGHVQMRALLEGISRALGEESRSD